MKSELYIPISLTTQTWKSNQSAIHQFHQTISHKWHQERKNITIYDIDISCIKGATEASSRQNEKINKVSKGRVSEADYAVEGFNLAKNQILS